MERLYVRDKLAPLPTRQSFHASTSCRMCLSLVFMFQFLARTRESAGKLTLSMDEETREASNQTGPSHLW